MKLIIKEYLAALRERGELDAIIPDMLSQLGLHVFSEPTRGTTQRGVDVAAEGKIQLSDGNSYEGIFLLSIKAGNLTRSEWDTGPQALRPSLNEILDSYIPHNLTDKQRLRHIYICFCIGGVVVENVRDLVAGFIATNTRSNIFFLEWNGDILADMINRGLLSDEVIASDAKMFLRKSIAMLESSEISYRYFNNFLQNLVGANPTKKERKRLVLQINLSLWILWAWGRNEKALETVYLSAELGLLYSWHLLRKGREGERDLFLKTLYVYQCICYDYLQTNVLPYTNVLHCLSLASKPRNAVDVNIKMFDILGRLCLAAIWELLALQGLGENAEASKQIRDKIYSLINHAVALLNNNPSLLSPVKDDFSLEVNMLCLLLLTRGDSCQSIGIYLKNLTSQIQYALHCKLLYPCIYDDYADFLNIQNIRRDEHYREIFEDATAGSILYPSLAFWAVLAQREDIFQQLIKMQREILPHCAFQLYYLNGEAEEKFYINNDIQGVTLGSLNLQDGPQDFCAKIFNECEENNSFENLSAKKSLFWPIILVGCRHYRFPFPANFYADFKEMITARFTQDEHENE